MLEAVLHGIDEMKVIKASVDLKTWTLPITCTKCSSDLEVCAKDIRYDYPKYLVTCCLCEAVNEIPHKSVPEIVQTDVCKHRYVSHPCDD